MQDTPSLYRRGARLTWRFMRTHPGPFTVSVVGAVLFSAAAVAVPWIVGTLTDELVGPAFTTGVSGEAVLAGVGILVGAGLVRGVSIIVRRYFAAMVEARMQVTLRQAVVDKYLTVPLSYYQAHPTGELLAHAEADVTGTTTSIKPLPFSIGVVALVVFALASLIAVDWTFALVALVLFPLLALINRRYTTLVQRPAMAVQELLGEVSGLAHESFDGALAVKTLGIEESEARRFSGVADRLRGAALEVGGLRASFDPVLDTLPSLGTLALFVVGGWRITSGAVTAGDLVQAALLFSILGFPMRVFGFFLQEMPRAVVSVDRIDAVVASPDAPGVVGDEPAEVPDGPLGLEVHDLRCSYLGEEVVRGATFRVDPGDTVALVGSTGAGKSTIVAALVRLVEPDSGRILLGGVDVRSLDPERLREVVSLVFQESFLFAATLRENVSLGEAGDGAVDRAAGVARVERFVSRMPARWDTVVGERGVTLSGGQRQRVALARALARGPRVLVLDDATSAVDPTIEAQILAGLREQSATLLVVAHRLSTIRLADRVVYLDAGVVAGSGTHEELLESSEGYRNLVHAYEQLDEPVPEDDDEELVS